MNMTVLLIAFGSATAFAIVVGLAMSAQKKMRRRTISIISGSREDAGTEDNKDKMLAKQRADIAKKLKEAEDEGKKKDKDKTTVKELLVQAGIEAPVSQFWIWSAVFAVFVYFILTVMTSWPPIAVIFATFTAFLGIPRFFLKKKAARRQRKFLEEFPDALDASVRLLQAGMPISEAISMVSREYTGPLREEMQRIYDNQKVGVRLGDAALETAKRIPLTEVHMFATALEIQSETGSSLSEVLSNLSGIIRARFKLKRKIKALSSEAKASAAIIACLPVLVTLGLKLANPEYIALLYTTGTGKLLGAGAICWMLLGVFIMKQMINFKI